MNDMRVLFARTTKERKIEKTEGGRQNEFYHPFNVGIHRRDRFLFDEKDNECYHDLVLP